MHNREQRSEECGLRTPFSGYCEQSKYRTSLRYFAACGHFESLKVRRKAKRARRVRRGMRMGIHRVGRYFPG
eukprot:6811351-Prymnesium_polylepis.1